VPTSKQDSPSGPVVSKRGAIDVRVDAAHSLREPPGDEADASQRPATLLAQLPLESAIDELAQVQVQAEQLGAYLGARQEELDRREAELQAGWSALEAASREARLLVEEREADVIRREEAVQLREQQFIEREQAVAQQAARSHSATASCERENVTAATTIVEDQLDQRWQAERRQWEQQRQRDTTELSRQRRMLDRRGQILDSRRTALEQLRADLTRRHRETLELRLATEELWAQMSQELPAEELAQSLHRLRNQVADHYRLARAELAQRQQALERLRSQVAAQHERLSSEREQVIQWAERRQQELDARSACGTPRVWAAATGTGSLS
jgi:hypothetical protein